MSSSDKLHQELTKEYENTMGFHSSSPQFKFYSKRLVDKLDSLMYKESINKYDYAEFTNGMFNKKDTKAMYTTAGLDVILERYKPRLGTLDILFNAEFSKLKVLLEFSQGINSSIGGSDIFIPELPVRINYLINLLDTCEKSFSKEDRSVYYHLSLFKSAILMCGKIHPNTYTKSLCDIYKDIYFSTIDRDVSFYKEYQESFNTGLFVEENNRLEDSNLFGGGSGPSQTNNEYNYSDYLKDYALVLIGLVTYDQTKSTVEDVAKNIENSSMPNSLKVECLSSIYNLRTSFIESHTKIITPYYWYNEVQDDFIHYCTPEELEEGALVSNCICNVMTTNNLVEFYINEASMISLVNEGSDDSYNLSLYDNLRKLGLYGLLDNYQEVYEMFKR